MDWIFRFLETPIGELSYAELAAVGVGSYVGILAFCVLVLETADVVDALKASYRRRRHDA